MWRTSLDLLGAHRLQDSSLLLDSLLTGLGGKNLDLLYSRLTTIHGCFFPDGWGDLQVINYAEDIKYVKNWPPAPLQLDWKLKDQGRRDGVAYRLFEAKFRTPCREAIYNALPPESRQGRAQLLVPANLQPLQDSHEHEDPITHSSPACVLHLAATGDQGFSRRLGLGFPLLKQLAMGWQNIMAEHELVAIMQGISSMILESPFYGARKPADQRRSKLRRVSDLLLLGCATIHESMVLLHGLQTHGFQHLGITGISMGGVHAGMTAGLYPGDVACIPLIAPRSAAVAYCDGAMNAAMSWDSFIKEKDEKNNDIRATVREAAQAVSVMREATYALQHLAELEKYLQAHSIGVSTTSTDGSLTQQGAAGMPSMDNIAQQQGSISMASTITQHDSISTASIGASSMQHSNMTQGLNISFHKHDSTDLVGACMSSSSVQLSHTASQQYAETQALQQQLQTIMQLEKEITSGIAEHHKLSSLSDNIQHQPQQSSSMLVGEERQLADSVAAEGSADTLQQHRHSHPHTAGHHTEHHQHHQHHHGSISKRAVNHQQQQAGQLETANIPHVSPGSHPKHASPSKAGSAQSHTHNYSHPSKSTPLLHDAASHVRSQLRSLAMSYDAAMKDLRKALRAQGLPSDLAEIMTGKQLFLQRAGNTGPANQASALKLKQVLETYTDVTRYPVPVRPDAAILVAARDDAYVSTSSVEAVHRYWPGSELRLVSGGHVSSFLFHQDKFRQAIADSMSRVARPKAV